MKNEILYYIIKFLIFIFSFDDVKMSLNRNGKLVINASKCMVCHDIVESKHRWDFTACSCGNLAVDGGKDYLKRSVKEFDKVLEMSVFESLK